MVILSVDLTNINLDVNFDEFNPESIAHVRLMAWHSRFKQRKAFKKEIRKKLMPHGIQQDGEIGAWRKMRNESIFDW